MALIEADGTSWNRTCCNRHLQEPTKAESAGLEPARTCWNRIAGSEPAGTCRNLLGKTPAGACGSCWNLQEPPGAELQKMLESAVNCLNLLEFTGTCWSKTCKNWIRTCWKRTWTELGTDALIGCCGPLHSSWWTTGSLSWCSFFFFRGERTKYWVFIMKVVLSHHLRLIYFLWLYF